MPKYFLQTTVPVVQPSLLQHLWECKTEHDPSQIDRYLTQLREVNCINIGLLRVLSQDL